MSAGQAGTPPTAGYSGTPLHRKLGVKPGHRVLVRAAPVGWDVAQLDPDGTADVLTAAEPAATSTVAGPFDVVLLFCPDRAAMAQRLPSAMAGTTTAGRCWVAWPKRASGVPTDLTEDPVRDAALAVGWVDVKVCAVDAIWSGLCLVRRKGNR
jgi:hypothetical protein